MDDFYVSKSLIEGYGCFSNRSIKKDERVWFTVLPIKRPHNLTHVYSYTASHSCMVLSEFCYCNHSNNPNFEVCSLKTNPPQIGFLCIRDVDIHEEITISYRDNMEDGPWIVNVA